jgi:hypothetical protein
MIPEQAARQAITLAGQGWSVSAIARHVGHDRKTVRIYLNGHRAPGQPRPHAHSFAPFAAYVRQRAAEDCHLRGTGLHREITALGYAGSYSAFTRELRGHGITAGRCACKPWQPVTPARQQLPALLPARVAPLAGETVASYLSRLAAASHLPVTAITDVLPPWFAVRAAACDDLASSGHLRPGDVAHLAAITGISETALRQRSPRSPEPVTTGARQSAPLSPADAAQPGMDSVPRSRCTSPHTSGHANTSGPGSAGPSRSTSLPPPTSSARGGKPPASPASTASPGSCSPRQPLASRRPAARAPGRAPRPSPWPIPAWTWNTRT